MSRAAVNESWGEALSKQRKETLDIVWLPVGRGASIMRLIHFSPAKVGAYIARLDSCLLT